MQEHPNHPPCCDTMGKWVPPRSKGGNILVAGDDSGKYWYCDGQFIHPVPALPAGCEEFKTYSLYYDEGNFWIFEGDASAVLIALGDDNSEENTADGADSDWHHLSFDHEEQSCTSYLTNAGQHTRLRTQRPDQAWPQMLLPEQFHSPAAYHTTYQQYGGLTGELPIFLGLIAFSIRTNAVGYAFQACFTAGAWNTHNLPHGRKCSTLFLLPFTHTAFYIGTDKRGMVVRVWSPPEAEPTDLEHFEVGHLGKYFN